jgi:hypothetical protein
LNRFTKFPVALSGGKIEKLDPVAGENETTVPSNSIRISIYF